MAGPEATQPVGAATEGATAATTKAATTTDPTATEEITQEQQEETPPPDIYDEIVAKMAPDSYQGVVISDDERENLLGNTNFFRCGQRAFINDLAWALASKNNEYRLSKKELDWLFYNHEKHATKAFGLFAASYKEVACAEVFEEMDYEPFSGTEAQTLSEEIKTNREFFKGWGVHLTLKALTRLPLGLPPADASEDEPPVLIPTETSLLKYTSDYRAMARVLDAYVAHGYEEEVRAFLTATPEMAKNIKSRMRHDYTYKVDEESQTVTIKWLDEKYQVSPKTPEASQTPPPAPGATPPPTPPKPNKEQLEQIARNLVEWYGDEDLSELKNPERTVNGITYVLTSTTAPASVPGGGGGEEEKIPNDTITEPSVIAGGSTAAPLQKGEPIKIQIKPKKDVPVTKITVEINDVPIEDVPVPPQVGDAPQEVVVTIPDATRDQIGGGEVKIEITGINGKDLEGDPILVGSVFIAGAKREEAPVKKESIKIAGATEVKKGDTIKVELETTKPEVKLVVQAGGLSAKEVTVPNAGPQTVSIITTADWDEIGENWNGNIKIVSAGGISINKKLKVTVKGEEKVEPPPPPPPVGEKKKASECPYFAKIKSGMDLNNHSSVNGMKYTSTTITGRVYAPNLKGGFDAAFAGTNTTIFSRLPNIVPGSVKSIGPRKVQYVVRTDVRKVAKAKSGWSMNPNTLLLLPETFGYAIYVPPLTENPDGSFTSTWTVTSPQPKADLVHKHNKRKWTFVPDPNYQDIYMLTVQTTSIPETIDVIGLDVETAKAMEEQAAREHLNFIRGQANELANFRG